MRRSSSYLGLGALSLGALSYGLMIAEAPHDLHAATAADGSASLFAFLLLVFTLPVLVGLWRRMRRQKGSGLLLAAVAVSLGGIIVLWAVPSLSSLSDSLQSALAFLVFGSQPLAVLLAGLSLIQSGAVPKWAAVCGIVGTVLELFRLGLRAFFPAVLQPPVLVFLRVGNGVLTLVFWMAVGFTVAQLGAVVGPASNKRIERTPQTLS